jgi:N-methylhydantoinase B
MEPASLPAGSRELYQEGLIIPPTRLDDGLVELIAANSRAPDERRGDLRAQLAAHRLADARIDELVARRGREAVSAAMDELVAYSERRVRAAISALPDGRYAAADVIEAVEGDLEIRAAVTIDGEEVEIDFDGTALQYAGNLNCPLAVTRAACYFVVRVVADPDIPASAGAFAPVTVKAPLGSLVNARPPAAVVAGNTETSSRITDVVMAAFRQVADIPAAGQGTMNNTTFGTSAWTYYETIGGGQGASARADGPSAVHVAMSNALNTPVEALELAYPLRVERYAVREGSGGIGQCRGGDGVVREIRVLEPCRLSVLGDRRRHPPPGGAGGESGARGRTLVNGAEVPGKETRWLAPGDVVRTETPGGGGYGVPDRAHTSG